MSDTLREAFSEAVHTGGYSDDLMPSDQDRLLRHPAMAAIAEKVALADAVERLERWGMDGWVITCDAQEGLTFQVRVDGYDPIVTPWCGSLKEAIDAALEDKP